MTAVPSVRLKTSTATAKLQTLKSSFVAAGVRAENGPMTRPFLLRLIPNRLERGSLLSPLSFVDTSLGAISTKIAHLAACPQVRMYDLLPGDVISGMLVFTRLLRTGTYEANREAHGSRRIASWMRGCRRKDGPISLFCGRV